MVLLGTPLVVAGQGPAAPEAVPAPLTVGGDVKTPLTITPEALKGYLRGDAVASYVVASASDGYQVVFSLAEPDPAFSGSEIIVADTTEEVARCSEPASRVLPALCWWRSRPWTAARAQ